MSTGYRIVKKEVYSSVTYMWEVEAPDVARAAQPGHFLMVRINEEGERIPLTVADFDRQRGTVTVVIQAVGKSTREMMALAEGDSILDFIGPLGEASHIQKRSKVILVGGGLGVAPVYPQLRAYKELGSTTLSIIGFRTKALVFWEEKFRAQSDELHIATDDGSYGHKGFVSQVLQMLLERHRDTEEVVAIGPLPMMRVCCDVSHPFGVRTMVSLNSIMVDGTGMCGSCRVTVGGKLKFACVDGPDFDGHQVDFDELMRRQRRFQREEQESLQQYEEECRLLGRTA
ncbi:MAG: ferredoxin-NADP reductase [candidate division NC10 bacterium RIFCSPLOWO2_12_FULL_66_18]|nr:MAG: ferredoxin-NADP reductase [candidate division NC10 bacterium RIFCSPLOWO2_02_FULL_66_22]OGB96150.1 MAG: ferredoxin-NADP reductase [candidate division NC10 bacterium RIFCSPLOWO2_12_FULL_66_18]